MSNAKSQINNNYSNGIANLCCQQPNSVTNSSSNENNVKPLMEQNIPKKTIKIIDAPNSKVLDSGKIDDAKSTTPADQTSPSQQQKPRYKIVEDENNVQGVKLTDIALPHISVKTIECKKNEKPTTTIVIYKPKNGGAPTAKVIMTKVS